jgi:hypothetical protein
MISECRGFGITIQLQLEDFFMGFWLCKKIYIYEVKYDKENLPKFGFLEQ